MSSHPRTAPPPVPRTTPARPWQQWNTPQRLWASVYLIWALDALLLMSSIIGAQVHRDAMKGVGKDSAPSIIHAQHIKAAMADMDANAANELLSPPGDLRTAAIKEYENQRKKAATALIEAAKNITYGDAEQIPIEHIQIGLGTFEGLIQKARDLRDESDAAFVDAYREAARLMDDEQTGLYKEADNLDQANDAALNRIYQTQKIRSMATVTLLLLVAAAMLAALIGVQKFLNQRTHRILNPLLLASTLVTVGFVLYTMSLLGSERQQLRIAKEDAFTSIHALWRARALAYAAKADESRYFLDTTHAGDHEAAFFKKAALLAKIPEGMRWEDVIASAQQGNKLEGFSGLLADELNNITFEGERDEAVLALSRWSQYLDIGREIRHRRQSGNGESNAAFDKFDRALGQTLDINQKEFDKAVRSGLSALSYFELKASMVAVIIALLVFFGLRQRIQEYS